MNGQNPFYAFVSLVNTDDQLRQAYRQKENLTLHLEQLVIEQESKLLETQKLQAKLHELKKQLHAKELELELLQDRFRTKKHKLDQIASPREYLSLQHELQELEASVNKAQEIVLNDMQELENTEPVLQQARNSYEQYLKEYEIKKSEIIAEQEKIAITVQELLEKREEQEKLVYPPLLEQYEVMKQKVANPAVPVVQGNCSGCFYIITAHDLNMLKKHKIIHCAECYRLLYIQE